MSSRRWVAGYSQDVVFIALEFFQFRKVSVAKNVCLLWKGLVSC